MKRLGLTNQILGLSAFCIITTTVHAGIPLWSFSPNESPVVTVSATETATVSYTITNNSKKPHRLVLSSKTPVGISQPGAPCVLAGNSPTNPNPTCTLNLSINGSALPANTVSGGPVLCQANSNNTPNLNQCYQPGRGDTLVITRTTAPGEATLSTSIAPPSILALSVNNGLLNPALTGSARQITIQNTGTTEATGLNITYPAWPGGTPATTASSTCGATLAAGATCTITVLPGSEPTSDCNTGIVPTPGTISVSATNVASAVTSDVVVLSYGCQYQGGFLYSVDDTTANTDSIGGKVAGLDNVSNSNRWINATGTDIPGAESNTNGIQNTDEIVANLACTSSPNNCAAYQCRNNFTAGGYTDWYLPAICEEGFDRTSNGSGCGSGDAPTIQNMQSNLVDNGNVGSLSDFYWSSTEYSPSPTVNAWNQDFATGGGGGGQYVDNKLFERAIRCSRALTI